MGSIFKSSTPPPPPPPPPAPTIRDEIGGTEQVAVKNKDGTTTYVTRKLPLTAEQQGERDELQRIMGEALSEIEKLSSADYTADAETQKILDSWEESRSNYLEESYNERRYEEEKILARRGLSDSSAATRARRQLRLDRQDAQQTLEREKTLLGNDIRNQRLASQQNLYGIAAQGINADEARTYQSAAKGFSSFATLDSSNRASLADYYDRQRLYSASVNQNNPTANIFSSFLGGDSSGSVGTTVGTAIGGPAGGVVGGFLGNTIGKLF